MYKNRKLNKNSNNAAKEPGNLEEMFSSETNIPASQRPMQRYVSERRLKAGTLCRTQSRSLKKRSPNTYFELVLMQAGVQLDKADKFVLSCDYVAFPSKFQEIIVNSQYYPENIEIFKTGLRNALNVKSKYLQKLLSGCTISMPGEERTYQSQDSMMVNFLIIDFLRQHVLEVLLDKIEEAACGSSAVLINNTTPLLPLLLAQLRYVTFSHGDLIYTRIKHIFEQSTDAAKWDIIASSEFIIDSAKHDEFAQMLLDHMPSSKNLLCTNAGRIDYDAGYAMCIKQEQIKQEDFDIKFDLSTTRIAYAPAATPKSTVSNMFDVQGIKKRRRSTSRKLIEKRRKLHLKMSAKINTAALPDGANTLYGVNKFTDCRKQQQPHLSFGKSITTQDIINYSMADDNSSSTIGTITNNNNTNNSDSSAFYSNNTSAHTDNPSSLAVSPVSPCLAYTDEDSLYTQRYNSFTNHTNHTVDFTTSANSSALSTSTTIQTKKRGRPSKERSSKPDPTRIEHLPDAERKKAKYRAKNNEASRLSRLKKKLKEEAEVREVKKLTERNIEMKAVLESLSKISAKLNRALQRHVAAKPGII